MFTAIQFDFTWVSLLSDTSSWVRSHVDLTLEWLLRNFLIIPNSLRCHIGIMSVSLWFNFDITSDTLRGNFEFTLLTLWCHLGVASSSHRAHFDFRPFCFSFMSLRFQFIRFYVRFFHSIPLRFHFDPQMQEGTPPVSTQGKRGSSASQKEKEKRQAPIFKLEFH